MPQCQYVVCLSFSVSVCPSETFRYRDHIGWNTRKIISRLNSLRHLCTLTPSGPTWTPSKLGWNRGWGHEHNTCNISETVQDETSVWRTNRKAEALRRFRLVPKSCGSHISFEIFDYKALVGFSVIPKCVTLNDFQTWFKIFCAGFGARRARVVVDKVAVFSVYIRIPLST